MKNGKVKTLSPVFFFQGGWGRLGVFLAAVLLFPAAVLGEVRIGALSDDVGPWQEIAAQAQSAGLDVSVQGFSEGDLYQQVYIYSLFGRAKVDLVEVPANWLPGVLGRLLDLSPYEKDLEAEGVAIYRYAGRAVGVVLPWRDDAFAAILSRSPNAGEALEVLLFLGGQPAQPSGPTATPSPALATPVPLRLGPVTITKPELNLPGVDGSLEILAQAMAQALPQGLVTALSRVPEPAREAITTVAQMFGIPLTPDGTSVQLVVKSYGGAVPLAAGAREQARSPSGLSLVTVPLSQLSTFLSSVSGRAVVRPPYIPIPLAVSEGANLVGASAFHSQGITGSGVKVAIIDLGFKGLASSQARGDLPYSVVTRDFTGTGIETGYYHGTAVAEIVHDIAPDAQLYLIKIGNEVDLDNAVTYCISEGIDVINHSLGWYNTNFYDGSGTIGDIVRRATSAGILWVQAAGNDALKHWEGLFSDADSDNWLDTEITFSASAGDNILLYLTWDGWPQTADDYDLYLYGPGGSLVASSTKTQGGTEEPTERVSTTAPQSGTYRIKIQLASGSARRLELFSIYQDLNPYVASSSIPAPGNAAEALAVAAIAWNSYTTGPAEAYSSRGPTNDGRQKPDLAAPDNVTTGVPYYAPFPGTSAAAPHVAGIAALLLSEDPSLTLSQLKSRLLAQCVAMGDPNTYGAGRLEAAPQGPTPQPDLVIQDITYSPASPAVGSTVSFQVTVRNQGSAGAGAFAVAFAGQVKSVSSLAAGASATLSFSATLTTSPQTFTAVADYYGQVAESDESNNQRQVTVSGQAPLAAEAGGPYSGIAGQPIAFDGSASQGPIISYTWDFGDGSTASGAVVTHIYALPGSYTARLTVRASDGRTATDTAQVTVSAAPQPDLIVENITYSPSSPAVGSTVTFQITVRNQGGAPAGGFYLRLEGTSGHRNAYISGLAAGAAHTVSLSLTLSSATETFTATADYLNQVAESDETNNTRQVTVTAAAPPLTLSISLDRTSYQVGDPVRITVNLSRSAYVYLVEVDSSGAAKLVFPNFWERDPRLPAGTTVLPRASYTIQASEPTGSETMYGFASDNPIPYFPTSFPTPTFPTLHTNGTYFLSLVRAWLSANAAPGTWDEAQAAFTVTQAANQPPQAAFSYSPASPSVGQWISFDASASRDPDGTIVSYEWNFDDGTTASGVRVNKRYGAAGTYTVRLTVRDDRGATDTQAKTVTVGPPPNQPPQAAFSYSPANPDPGAVVSFDATASGDPDGTIVSYEWEFGDGATATGAVVTHVYSSAGTYTVRLTVRDDDGATDSVSKTIQVGTPAVSPLPGMPEIDRPGIYVWGDPSRYWHITVAGDPSWASPRPFSIRISGRGGSIRKPSVTPEGTPQPSLNSRRDILEWEGNVGPGWVDLKFSASFIFMLFELSLDLDGDGTPETVPPDHVYLRQKKVNPPVSPFVLGRMQARDTQIYVNKNFKIGSGNLSQIVWLTTIEDLER